MSQYTTHSQKIKIRDDGEDVLEINADGSINIGASPLPSGAATEAKQDTQITNQGTICSVLIKSMLYLDNIKRGNDVHLYINCPGGSVDDTMAIYDTMRFMKSDVCTYCVGHAMSGAALILAAGTKGKRFALPHAQVMLHQPWGGIGGQAADIKIQAEEILKTKDMINGILAQHTGQSLEKVRAETERDRYMSAEEAKE